MVDMNRDPHDALATRPSLLHRVRDTGDQESWRDLYQTYSGLVHRFALWHGLTESEAQDVVQETFVAVSKAMPEFRYNPSVGSFRNWMLQTTHWRIVDQYRKRRPNQVAPALGVSLDHQGSSLGATDRVADQSFEQMQSNWDREWHKTLLQAALQKIKPRISARQFQVFDLYVLKEWPVLKVARSLNVNVGQVYLIKHRVSRLVRDAVKQLEPQFNP